MKTIAVIGMWHLGIVNVVGFAQKGHRVVGIDFDKTTITKLKKGEPPLYEPGIENELKKHLATGKIQFSTNFQLIGDCDWVVIAHDTPLNDRDEANLAPILTTVYTLGPVLNPEAPVIITSQVPVGTAEKIDKTMKKLSPTWRSGVVYVPENLRLGSALKLFSKPDFLVIGSNNQSASKKVLVLYRRFKTKKILMDLRSAEMVKHALNTYLAMCIGFGNELAHISDKLRVDGLGVIQAIANDSRIGRAPIFPGLGYSGGTLARDIKLLKKFARKIKYPARLVKSIEFVNNYTFEYVVALVEQELGNLIGKTIGVLGLTYKPGTSTMRRSPALIIMKKLTEKGARCIAFDPKADVDEVKKYQNLFIRATDEVQLASRSDILLLITPWSEFRRFDYKKLSKKMKKPVIIDAKNFLDETILKRSGFRLIGYGRGNTL